MAQQRYIIRIGRLPEVVARSVTELLTTVLGAGQRFRTHPAEQGDTTEKPVPGKSVEDQPVGELQAQGTPAGQTTAGQGKQTLGSVLLVANVEPAAPSTAMEPPVNPVPETMIQEHRHEPATPECHVAECTVVVDLAQLSPELASAVVAAVVPTQPTHFTCGIIGPVDVNRFGASMDFDMTVLWLAAWCRRSRGDREGLLNDLHRNDIVQKRLSGRIDVADWLSNMESALNQVVEGEPLGESGMNLQQISDTIGMWNRNRRFLSADDHRDLLSYLEVDDDMNEARTYAAGTELTSSLVPVLIGERGMETIFTNQYDVSPGWVVLNLLRHWTVIGRKDRFPPSRYGPRQTPECIQLRIDDDVRAHGR